MAPNTEESKKQLVKDCVAQMVEVLDNHIPIIGNLMDLPFIDAIESSISDRIVDLVWDIDCSSLDCLDWDALVSA